MFDFGGGSIPEKKKNREEAEIISSLFAAKCSTASVNS
jgi:hypothetical protein